MNKSFLTLMSLVLTLSCSTEAVSGGRVNLDYAASGQIVCNYISDPEPIRYYSYNDTAGTGGGGRVYFPFDSDKCVGSSSGTVGGVAPPYIPPEGVIFASSVVTYYHNDALGSPVAATDGEGKVLWKEEYRPYGTRLLKEDNGTNEEWFTGKPHEEEIGLSYFGARWYDPESGRFMGVDPVGVDPGNFHSFNRYAYANNNPYRYVDPDGNIPIDTVWDIGNVIYDAGKIGYGLFTGNNQVVNEGLSDIALDGAAILIPYVPAGITKLKYLDDVGDVTKGAGKADNAPDFVVSPGGTAFPVPKGATGPTPVVNPAGKKTGDAFTGGSGGANGQVDTMRMMDPTPPRGNSPGYPNGYIKYENKAGQGVDPYTGRTLSNKDSHFPID